MQALKDQKGNSYDQVPYESFAFPQAHPVRLSTIAKLFGANPPSVKSARILELGCAAGGHIIPIAKCFPNSRIKGVDASLRQIKDGREVIESLGLSNIELDHLDVMEIDESYGTFDYIIAHGIFSWVGNEIQEKILSICEKNLSPDGIAFISYNTYPGWHFRGMIRDMMMYHAGTIEDPVARAQQGRALLDFLSNSVPTENNAYGLMLKNELDLVRDHRDSYLLHEYLEEANQPTYFYQFAERFGKHGLQYLGEAEFSTMLTGNFPKEVDETLRRISNEIVRTEQYMDFVRHRTFRQTLLCHQSVQINRNLTFKDVTDFFVASPVKLPTENFEVQSGKSESFLLPNGLFITSPQPLIKAAFQYLSEIWPQSASFDELLNAARERIAPTKVNDPAMLESQRQLLGADLLTAYASNGVVFRTEKADFITYVSEMPRASDLARYQATTKEHVTNQLHETIPADVFTRNLIAILDGTLNKAEILEEMHTLVKNGTLFVHKDGKQLTEGEPLKLALKEVVNDSLVKISKAAILIA
jgi:methyltransferase-like protein/SAM-dependent methyltransferase